MILPTLFIILITILILLISILYLFSPVPRKPTEKELQFINVSTQCRLPFPSLYSPSSIQLSVIIPAYNETKRLPRMLDETLEYLLKQLKIKSFEIILVDDGSNDGTSLFAMDYAREFLSSLSKTRKERIDFRVMSLEKNRGKGGAVTQGMLVARGEYILFADADGASKFSDLKKLMDAITPLGSKGVAIGSRAHMVGSSAVIKRSFIRNFLMKSFHLILYILGIQSIRDTQCGFKLFTREAAQEIFKNMHVEGWIFDIEILLLASMKRIPIKEIPIDWHEVDGTKLDLTVDAIRMLRDLIIIRLNYLIGFWSFE